jgi:hypothetical protein
MIRRLISPLDNLLKASLIFLWCEPSTYMYDSGTPTVCLGWARPSSQAKNQYVVVPLSAHTMQKQHMQFANTLMGF